eukprot:scaffold37999_cov214-Skeletonema_marinoi.AAC.16
MPSMRRCSGNNRCCVDSTTLGSAYMDWYQSPMGTFAIGLWLNLRRSTTRPFLRAANFYMPLIQLVMLHSSHMSKYITINPSWSEWYRIICFMELNA